MLVFWIFSYSSSAPSSVDCDNWTEKKRRFPLYLYIKNGIKFEILTQNYEKNEDGDPIFLFELSM
jgi:hypothetical protein